MMPRGRETTRVIAVLGLLCALFLSPAHGEGALAVAIPDDGLSKGFSFGMYVNAEKLEDARKEALLACQEAVKKNQDAANEKKIKVLPARCKLVEAFKKSCVAVAVDAKGQWAGWAVFKDEKTARARALGRCKMGGISCAVAESQCDK
jgi:hypothetical protein